MMRLLATRTRPLVTKTRSSGFAVGKSRSSVRKSRPEKAYYCHFGLRCQDDIHPKKSALRFNKMPCRSGGYSHEESAQIFGWLSILPVTIEEIKGKAYAALPTCKTQVVAALFRSCIPGCTCLGRCSGLDVVPHPTRLPESR